MLTKQEKKIIKDEFINLENFIMFYNDLEMYNNNKKGLDLYFDLTPFTSKGIVTGVFALVNYDEDKNIMNVDVICQNAHRYLEVKGYYKRHILELRDELIAQQDERDNKNFEFIISKPFLLAVENNVITFLRPLDFNHYETYIPILDKILSNN